MKETGIVLIALGKRGYGFAAYNLAFSIKHYNPNIKIHLIHDGSAIKQLQHFDPFDKLTKMDAEDYTTTGKLDPGKAKVRIYKYLPFKNNLYLDVDALALQDVQPLIERCIEAKEYYMTDVLGASGKGVKRNYSIWANDADIWDFFGLKDNAVYPAIQSSWCFIKRGRDAQKLFKAASKFYDKGFPLSKIKMNWGDTVPDELIFGGALASVGFVPTKIPEPIFRGWQFDGRSFTELQEAYYLLSIYGNGNGRTLTKLKYWEWYDRMMVKMMREAGRNHIYKGEYIKQDKHANQS